MKDAFSLTPWQVPGYLEGRDGHLSMDGVDLPLNARVIEPVLGLALKLWIRDVD